MKNQPFSVSNGTLYYDNAPVGYNATSYAFPRLYFDDQPVSENGANGVVFLATHTVLGIKQAVKLWRPEKLGDGRKAEAEARKNATRLLGDTIARVNDAGDISYPDSIFFSVMEIIDNSLTLQEWILRRNEQLSSLKQMEVKEDINFSYSGLNNLEGYAFAQALNVTAGSLLSAIKVISLLETHGDLHGGNLLVRETPATNFESSAIRREVNPGYLSPADVRVIDIGTSQISTTTREVGQLRDSDKIIENVRRLLSPVATFFNSSLKEWLHIEKDSEQSDTPAWLLDGHQVSTLTVCGDLLRLTAVLNLILGFARNSPQHSEGLCLETQDLRTFRQLMSLFGIDNHIDGVSDRVPSALNLLGSTSSGSIINWSQIWKRVANNHRAFSKYQVVDSVEHGSYLIRKS